ncbi:hypothetical protein [Streptomyces sp. NPDC050738]|uniref:DUF6891 domain-containing protein n=1 Tax=Streptomyces sp. NPDC050738 TaxID=3154744 RepID=UPI003444633F
MLAISVTTEPGETYERISAPRLSELVGRIGPEGDQFLVVERIPQAPDVFVQVWHETGGDYQLEHRSGGPDAHFQSMVATADLVAEVMASWARDVEGWDAGVVWKRLDLAVPEIEDGVRVQVEEHVRELLAVGYHTRAELAEAAEEWLVVGDHRPVSKQQAWALVHRLWQERLEEQAGWEGETDPERVEAVFAALEEDGITGRAHFTCCRSCGLSEIWGAGREDARGFVFFHSQGAGHAAAGHGLTLMYGGFDGSAETTAAVGREVAAALAGADLPVEWNGSPDESITVAPLDWRKRLAG